MLKAPLQEIGRFLSADPHIQSPYDTQSYNRYTYVKNNPLKYTDPSGFFLKGLIKKFHKSVKKFMKYVVLDPMTHIMHSRVVKNFFINNQWAQVVGSVIASYFGGPAGAAGFSAYLAEIQGGSVTDMLRSAAFSYGSAYIAYGVAEVSGSHTASFLNGGGGIALKKAVLHGVTRGIITKAQGGKISAGFWSGFVASGFAAPTSWGVEAGTVVTSLVSGTVSEISGGKFANGAVTGAFVHLFNGEGIDKVMNALKINKMFGTLSSLISSVEKIDVGLELAKIQQNTNVMFDKQLLKYDMVYESDKYLTVMKMQREWNLQMEIIRHNYAMTGKLNIKPLFKERE